MTEGEKKAEIRNRKEGIRKKKQDRRSGGEKEDTERRKDRGSKIVERSQQ